jgi:acetolactate synthase I/II/III large subunit
MTGSDLFVRALRDLNINEIFTLVGDHLNAVLAVAAKAGIKIIDMRHESGVTHAADAWARVHRRPAVALVTGGPGHTNALTGIATAHLAGSPLIAISGSRSRTMADRQGFQDIDQVSMTRPIVKWAAEPPNAAQIPFYLHRAYAEAISGRKGAVHLTIPVDLFTSSGEAPPVPPLISAAPIEPSIADIRKLAAALRAAKRPVIIAGSGAWWSDAGDELRHVVERTLIPLYTLGMGRGIVSDAHPLVMGIGHPAVNEAVRSVYLQADFVLVLGKRIDFRLAFGGARLFSPDATFAQVDVHPQEFGWNRRTEIPICADVKAALRQLLAEIGDVDWLPTPWLEFAVDAEEEWRRKLEQTAADQSAPLHPAAVFAELRRVLPQDVLYAWDGGDFTHWGRATLPALQPGAWVRLGPLATIGAGLPYGIAMQAANPGKPVVVITGDGSLGFYIAEMDTAVRHKLPIVIIVGNDAGWGLERELQAADGTSPTVACELRSTRYDIIMQGFGGRGETVESIDQLRGAVERAFASGVPYCINVNTRGVRSPFGDWQLMAKKK